MHALKTLHLALALALAGMTGAAFAQDANPSVESIINGLKKEESTPQVGRTRALRPGAAVSATANAPEPVAKPKPKAASVSMQVNFDFNSDRIAASSGKTMDTLAKALASPQLEDRKFTVVGHTDGKGSDSYNQALSARRARAVKSYLVAHGVDPGRLQSVGRGKSQLLNKADPEAAENRRVEILATDR